MKTDKLQLTINVLQDAIKELTALMEAKSKEECTLDYTECPYWKNFPSGCDDCKFNHAS